jgi:L-alanine-DL-glutamate epimerase-like enolase superfamily enzyme
MNAALRGHSSAKSAIDITCWDIFGKDTGKDIATLLGGRLQENFPLFKAVPLGPSEEMQPYVIDRKADQMITVSFMNDWTNEYIASYQPRSKKGIGTAPKGQGLGVELDLSSLGKPVFVIK